MKNTKWRKCQDGKGHLWDITLMTEKSISAKMRRIMIITAKKPKVRPTVYRETTWQYHFCHLLPWKIQSDYFSSKCRRVNQNVFFFFLGHPFGLTVKIMNLKIWWNSCQDNLKSMWFYSRLEVASVYGLNANSKRQEAISHNFVDRGLRFSLFQGWDISSLEI